MHIFVLVITINFTKKKKKKTINADNTGKFLYQQLELQNMSNTKAPGATSPDARA